MKRILGLFLFALPLAAQVNNPSVVAVPSTPSACNTLPLKVVTGTPNLYGTNGSGGCTAIGGSGSGAGLVGPVTNVTNGGFTVSTSNTAAQNQTAFAAVATAVNAATTPPRIYIPCGTYAVLTTGSSGLGTYPQGVTLEGGAGACTVLNFSGTGKAVQLGPSGWNGYPGGTDPVEWARIDVRGIKWTGCGSCSDGIYISSGLNRVYITGNWFYDFMGTTGSAVHGNGVTDFNFDYNFYLRDDQVLGNIILSDFSSWYYNFVHATGNEIACIHDPVNGNSVPCGYGITSEGNLMANLNICSGPIPCFRMGIAAGSGGNTGEIKNNTIESTGNYPVEFGTPGAGSGEAVYNLSVVNNAVELSSSSYGFVGPASSNTALLYANISMNTLRNDSPAVTPIVTLNNLSGQLVNQGLGNVGWTTTPTLHTVGSNINQWGIANLNFGGGLTVTDIGNGVTISSPSVICSGQTSDSFVGTGTLILHTDNCSNTWANWTPVQTGSNSFNLTGGGAVIPTDVTGSFSAAALNSKIPSSANYTVSISVTAPSGTSAFNASVVARANSAAVTYYEIVCDEGLGGCQMYNVTSGSATQLGTTDSFTWANGATHTLAITVSGTTPTTVTGKIDGVTEFGGAQTDLSPITAAGQAGIKSDGNGSATISNFLLQ